MVSRMSKFKDLGIFDEEGRVVCRLRSGKWPEKMFVSLIMQCYHNLGSWRRWLLQPNGTFPTQYINVAVSFLEFLWVFPPPTSLTYTQFFLRSALCLCV
jgi:hypothetical protein